MSDLYILANIEKNYYEELKEIKNKTPGLNFEDVCYRYNSIFNDLAEFDNSTIFNKFLSGEVLNNNFAKLDQKILQDILDKVIFEIEEILKVNLNKIKKGGKVCRDFGSEHNFVSLIDMANEINKILEVVDFNSDILVCYKA